MNEFANVLQDKTSFSKEIIQKLSDFNDLLYIKNEVLNLTRIKKEDSVYRNFLDSLNSIVMSEMKAAKKVVDIGSGSGFPAIALAIVFPHIKFTMVETTGKKVEFLKEAIKKLQLKNIRVIKGRAEELAHDKSHREKYDIITARAVAKLPVLAELTSGYVKVDGKLLLYKGMNANTELEIAKKMFQQLKLESAKVIKYTSFEEDDELYMVIIKKYGELYAMYPRSYSKIKKSN